MKVNLIGDVHGLYDMYYAKLNENSSIQLGDMGVGFPNYPDPKELPKQHTFIRGNHDNPEVCRKHPNYLGDFGYLPDWDMFYISGALSIDKAIRVEGRDWWDEEELYMKDANAALDLYTQVKPRIVVSHDCPEIAKIVLLTWKKKFNIPSRTNQLLQAMFERHQPSFWYFAHYHISKTFTIHNTQFQVLNEFEKIEIDV
jgi:hypothetical protein